MTFLLIYFSIGFVFDLGIFIMNFVEYGTKLSWGRVGYMVAILPFWPLFVIPFVRWALDPKTSRCAWCGNIAHSDDERKAHIMVCEKHPVTRKLNIAREALKSLEWDEHYLGRHGHCPYCGQTRKDGHMSECKVFLSLEDV